MKKLLFSSLFLLGLSYSTIAYGAIATTTVATTAITVAVSSANTASITPTANNLILVTVGSRVAASTPNEPTLTGNSLTWVKVVTTISSENRTTIFRALGASPTTGAITIDFGGQVQAQAGWQVQEFSGIDTSGSNGSGAIVQFATSTSGATNHASATLASFSSINNAAYGGSFWSTGGTPTLTAGSGFSMINQADQAVSVVGAEFQATNNTVVGITCSAADHGDIAGVEIKAASVAPATLTHIIRGLGTTRGNPGR